MNPNQILKASLISNSKSYLRNRIFLENENQIFFALLKNKLKKINIDLSTEDINNPNNSEINFYFDVPYVKYKNDSFKIFYAIESPAVLPKNYEYENYSKFDIVFTWNEKIIDNKKVFKINYSSDLSYRINGKVFEERALICNISSNKFSINKKELYTKRSILIKDLNNHENDFHLYGNGWDMIPKNKRLFEASLVFMKNKYLNKFYRLISKFLPKSFFLNFNNYKGLTHQKIKTSSNYKFALCFENIINKNGYISEKITDCFLSYTIPIYLGYNNVSELIPKQLYIDFRSFSSSNELIEFINQFSKKEYLEFKKNVDKFLKSSESNIFDVNYNVNKLIEIFQHQYK
jgi:alpha(1,3/1,4) fucosyltransferase